jgi:hypothetical protein
VTVDDSPAREEAPERQRRWSQEAPGTAFIDPPVDASAFDLPEPIPPRESL